MARPRRITHPEARRKSSSRRNQRNADFKNRVDPQAFIAYHAPASGRYGGDIHGNCPMDKHCLLQLETPGRV